VSHERRYGVSYRSVKGALLGPGSGIETQEQADRVVKGLRGHTTATPICESCATEVHPHDAVTVIRTNGWTDHYCAGCAPIEEDE
jgi:hypothetical protein